LKELFKVREIAVVDVKILSKSGLSQDLANLFSDMSLSDVELEIDGKTLKAHKNILISK
jgi:hypothetical protein